MADDLRARWGRASSPWRLLGLVVGSLVAFAPVLGVGFLSDDYDYLVAFGAPSPSLAWLTEPALGGHLRPVMWATVWLNEQVGGIEPWTWRLPNVVGHGVVAWLVGMLTFELLRTDPLDRLPRHLVAPAPLAASVLFLVAPNHAEPVVWIIARVDLVWAIPALVALWAWVRARHAGPGWRWVALGASLVALYAKESAMALPAVVLAYELWLPPAGERRTASLRRVAPALAGLVAVTVAYFAHRLLLDGSYLSGEGGALADESPALVVRRGLQVLARSVVPGASPAGLAVAVAAVVAVVVAATVAWRRLPADDRVAARRGYLRLGGLLGTSMVLLSAPVARLGVGVGGPAGERLAYVPSAVAAIGVATLLALVLAVAPRWGAVVAATLVVGSVVGLVAAERAYVRAGQLADAVVDDLGELPPDRQVVVLASPDSLEGIWVGRDGLGAALEVVHGWEEPSRYHELSGISLDDADAQVTVARGTCERCLVLRIAPGGGSFVEVPGVEGAPIGPGGEAAEVRRIDDRRIEVVLPAGVDAAELWYLSGGRLVPVDEGLLVPGS